MYMPPTNPGAMGIINVAVETATPVPIKLDLQLVKVVTSGRESTGNQSRYFHCYVGGRNVDRFVSDLTGLKQSKAADTRGAVIIHDCGMNMAYALQQRCKERAPKLFADSYGRIFDGKDSLRY